MSSTKPNLQNLKDAQASAEAYVNKLTPAMQWCIDTNKIITYGIGNMYMIDNGYIFSRNHLGDKFYLNPETNTWARLIWINTNAWQIELVSGTPEF